MNYRDITTTIGSVVASNPVASEIFDSVGIDFCCGGHRKLADIIQDQHIDAESLYLRLEEARDTRQNSYGGNDFRSMSPLVLSAYIEDTHHSYLRDMLPKTAEVLATILRVHGAHHRELFDVYRLFGTLKTELESHLLKEETMLFPIIMDGKEEELRSLTKEIMEEHEGAGELLAQLRHVTNNYHIPEDVCGTFVKAYKMLQELEQDLHQHIHLENNILLVSYDARA